MYIDARFVLKQTKKDSLAPLKLVPSSMNGV